MKKITSIVVSAALAVSMLLNAVQKVTIHADNPLAQNVYTADPAPMVHDGTLYLYTSHDKDGSDYFYMPDWQCYSTTDMQNWIFHTLKKILHGQLSVSREMASFICIVRFQMQKEEDVL